MSHLPFQVIRRRRLGAAFTIVEVLVSTAVLVLIILSVTLLFSAAQAAIGLNNKRSDADGQARSVFDRMAVDIAQMVRRPDVDYFLKDNKNAADAQLGGNGAGGNDTLAFYSQVPGYYLSANGLTVAAGSQSPVSLVSYRIGSESSKPAYSKLERMGCGLLWNGASTTIPSLIFSMASDSTGAATNTITSNWPTIKSGTTDNPSHYEVAGSQVFRFEYFYLLRGQSDVNPPIPSLTPWDTRPSVNHTAVNGMADVSAIVVTVALADPRSRAFATDDKWASLAAQMKDVADATGQATPNDMYPGNLTLQWQSVADGAAAVVGRPAAAGIRVYQRYFYLPQNPTP